MSKVTKSVAKTRGERGDKGANHWCGCFSDLVAHCLLNNPVGSNIPVHFLLGFVPPLPKKNPRRSSRVHRNWADCGCDCGNWEIVGCDLLGRLLVVDCEKKGPTRQFGCRFYTGIQEGWFSSKQFKYLEISNSTFTHWGAGEQKIACDPRMGVLYLGDILYFLCLLCSPQEGEGGFIWSPNPKFLGQYLSVDSKIGGRLREMSTRTTEKKRFEGIFVREGPLFRSGVYTPRAGPNPTKGHNRTSVVQKRGLQAGILQVKFPCILVS